MKKALYTAFGKTKSVPLRVYVDAKLVESDSYDETLWIERPEDWYAFASMRGVKVRVIERDVWLKSKAFNHPDKAKIDWQKIDPPNGVVVYVLCNDYTGDFVMTAMRKYYKKQNPKQKRVGWRWVDDNGERLSRKDTPSAWAHIVNTGEEQ